MTQAAMPAAHGAMTNHLSEHDLFRKPEPTFRDHALEHDLFRKPERTLRDHTLTIMPAGEARDGAPVLLGRPAAARLPRAGRRAARAHQARVPQPLVDALAIVAQAAPLR